MLWKLLETFFENYVPSLLEKELISTKENENFWKVLRQRTQNPGAFISPPPMVEIIGIKR